MRKSLNKEYAAHILQLLDEAEQLGLKRRVLFNQNPKTKDDIQGYISRFGFMRSPEDLLQYFNLDKRSLYIMWIDEDHGL